MTELKTFDTNTGASFLTASTTGTAKEISEIAEGTGDNQRIARLIALQRIKIHIALDSGSSTVPIMARLVVFVFRNQNTADGLQNTQIIQATGKTNDNLHGMYDPDFEHKYDVILDEFIESDNRYATKIYDIYTDMLIYYNDSVNPNHAETNGIWYLIYGRGHQYATYTRLYYYDN